MVQAGTTLGIGTPSAPVKNSEVAGFSSSSPVSERPALAAQGGGSTDPIRFVWHSGALLLRGNFGFVVEPLMTRCAIRKAAVLYQVEAHAAQAQGTGFW